MLTCSVALGIIGSSGSCWPTARIPRYPAKREGSALIAQYLRLRLRLRTSPCVLEHSARLLERHAGKPLDKLMNGCVVFVVFEERCHRHARPSEDPGSADSSGVAPNGSEC